MSLSLAYVLIRITGLLSLETREVVGTALAVSHKPLGWVAHGLMCDTAATFTNVTGVSDKSSITPRLNISEDKDGQTVVGKEDCSGRIQSHLK